MKSEIIAYKTLSFKIQSRKGLNRLYRIGKEKKRLFFFERFQSQRVFRDLHSEMIFARANYEVFF